MFIYNIKMNGTKIYKYFLIGVLIFVCILAIVVIFNLFKTAENETVSPYTSDSIRTIETKNYTNILKAVHDNVDDYVGTKFSFTGYVYRVENLNDTQFILARNMIVSSNLDYVVVGFLCNLDNAIDYKDNTWVSITGEITKGDFYGPMPIVNILEIKETEKPAECDVYPPSELYLPTSGVI